MKSKKRIKFAFRMTIRNKLLLNFACIILLFASTLVSSYVLGKKNDQLVSEMDILRQQLDSVQNLNYQVRSTDDDLATYLISTSEEKQRKYMVLYQQDMTNVTNELNVLKRITTDESDLADINRFQLEWQKYTRNNESVVKLFTETTPQKAQSLFTEIPFEPVIQSLEAFKQRQKENVDKKQAEIDKNDALTERIDNIIMGVTLVIAIIIIIIMNRTIARPLVLVSRQLKEIAEGEGDLTRELTVRSRDEVGDLANSFNRMLQNLRSLIHQVGLNAEQVAASAEELTASSEQTSKATEQIASTIHEMAEGSKQQVHSVENSSRIARESLIGIQQIAANTQSVTSIAVQTSEMAVDGNRLLHAAESQMTTINQTFTGLSKVIRSLGERSQEIGQISEVITGIAGQTNLLALNAAIEAARAGEHGRGFAVVADEVRKLAEQCSLSAQQISELIATIQRETGAAVESMEKGTQEVADGIQGVNAAGQSFKQIQQSIEEVTTQIQEVSAAAQQMFAGTEQIVHAISVIEEVAKEAASGTENVSAAAEEQMASMEEISSSAATLSNMAEELQLLIGRFKV